MATVKRFQSLIAQVVCDSKDLDLARKGFTLSILLFHVDGDLEREISTLHPEARDSIVTITHGMRPSSQPHNNMAVVAYTTIDIRSIEMLDLDIGLIVICVSQQPSAQRIPLTTNVLANVVLNTVNSDKRVEIVLGNFEPTDSEVERLGLGTTEIVCAISRCRHIPGCLEAYKSHRPDEWILFPIRKIDPFQQHNDLISNVTAEVSKLINSESRISDSIFFFEDLIDDLLGTQSRSAVPQTKTSPTRHENLPILPSDKEHRGDARSYQRELQSVVNLLKGTSEEFREMAKRIYEKPWEKNRQSAKDKSLRGVSEPSSSDEASSISSQAVRIEQLEKLKRDLREEFLEVLQNYMLKTDTPLEQESVNRSNRHVALLRRDFQLLLQRQIEMEHLLVNLSSIFSSELEKNERATTKSSQFGDGTQDDSRHDPLLKSFQDFTLGLEMVSQLIGSSFRHLQKSLHYPEAFKELASSETYPCSRKLLEFVTSKKASTLVADIETLAGAWRSAGTEIKGDQMSAMVPRDLRDWSRKPWWTLRPFDYS